jgi:hypothetical protein
MTPTPKAASAARTGRSTTDSDAAAAEAAPQAGDTVQITVTTAELPQTKLRPPPPRPPPSSADDGSDSDSDSSSDGEIPLCDAPVVKKRKVEARTSQISMTDSERYKREDAGCAARLKKQEPELLPCIDPEIGEDDQGVGARFQGYDGFTIGGPPVFR